MSKSRFLLGRLHAETIENNYTIRDILAALENLPEGRNAITETYDNAMQRIKDQSSPDRELAEKITQWVSHIREPLTLRELQCALTIREGDKALSHLSGPEIVKNVRAFREWKRHRVFWPESLVRAFDCDGDGDGLGDNDVQQSSSEFYVDPVDNPPDIAQVDPRDTTRR
jgi:hypothetical protein